MTPEIVCIVGESGSGKSLIAKELTDVHGYKELKSYTTRPKRNEEDRKTFVTKEEFDAIRDDLVAYTLFDNHEYGATRTQVEDCHVYVIDPDGCEMLAESIGRENFKVVYLRTSDTVRYERIAKDGGRDARGRVEHDLEKFADMHLLHDYDISLMNETEDQFDDNVTILLALLEKWFPSN